MDYNAIIQAIGSLGFPIVACFYLAYIHNDSEKRHSEERSKLTEAINNNTIILSVIKDRIGIEDKYCSTVLTFPAGKLE